MASAKVHLSRCSTMHYIKLVYRGLIFLAAVCLYVLGRIYGHDFLFYGFAGYPILLTIICGALGIEMFLRMFPSKTESMGCQKQFRRNYKPVPNSTPKLRTGPRTAIVAGSWLGLNGIFAALYFTRVIDQGILMLISLAFAVCDMICILFFCPFQTWIMKNKCCTTCRIYNWDFIMMFTPLVLVPNIFSWILLFLAGLLLVLWEVRLHLHPEWFLESCNKSLSCANCQEKLCAHKKQLRGFLLKRKKAERTKL